MRPPCAPVPLPRPAVIRFGERLNAPPCLFGGVVASPFEFGLAEPPPGRTEVGRRGGHLPQSGGQPLRIAPLALRQGAEIGPAPRCAPQRLGYRVAPLGLLVEHVGVVGEAKRGEGLARPGRRARGAIGLSEVRANGERLSCKVRQRRQTGRVGPAGPDVGRVAGRRRGQDDRYPDERRGAPPARTSPGRCRPRTGGGRFAGRLRVAAWAHDCSTASRATADRTGD